MLDMERVLRRDEETDAEEDHQESCKPASEMSGVAEYMDEHTAEFAERGEAE